MLLIGLLRLCVCVNQLRFSIIIVRCSLYMLEDETKWIVVRNELFSIIVVIDGDDGAILLLLLCVVVFFSLLFLLIVVGVGLSIIIMCTSM